MLSGGCPHPPVAPVPARDGQRQRKEKQRQCDNHPDDLRTIRHGTAVPEIGQKMIACPKAGQKSALAPSADPVARRHERAGARLSGLSFGLMHGPFLLARPKGAPPRAPRGGERRSKEQAQFFAAGGNGAERTFATTTMGVHPLDQPPGAEIPVAAGRRPIPCYPRTSLRPSR